MGELIIMLGTEDEKNIYKGHPGNSSYFMIYSLKSNGEIKLLRKVKNEAKDFEREGEHGSKEERKKVLELVGKIDIVLSKRNSPNLLRMAAKTEIQPVIIGWIDSIEEGLNLILEKFDEIYSLSQARKEGKRPDVLIIKKN